MVFHLSSKYECGLSTKKFNKMIKSPADRKKEKERTEENKILFIFSFQNIQKQEKKVI